MGVFTTIIMIVFFPLNFLLIFNGDFASGKEQQISKENQEAQKRVEGVENEKKLEIEKRKKELELLKPTKKENSSDLVIPSAHSSVVIDVDSGEILHYSNAKEQRQIASLTKIMTAILVMENIKDLNEVVTIDSEAVFVEGTKIGCPRSGYCISQRLKTGEQISAGELLKAMLMNSANDAAIALGKHMGGTQENFAEIMNKRAIELGLTDTHFCTPSGLEIDGREAECYSSAYDIGKIAAYSLKYDKIWSTFRLPNNTEIKSIDGKITHQILNTDLALDQIPDLIGGKTGFTPLAGYSLLMIAKDPTTKHKVVAVLLDDPTRWQDIKEMFKWTFDSYTWK
jgi:D-alanyl-D-alanine carboxypeptidase